MSIDKVKNNRIQMRFFSLKGELIVSGGFSQYEIDGFCKDMISLSEDYAKYRLEEFIADHFPEEEKGQVYAKGISMGTFTGEGFRHGEYYYSRQPVNSWETIERPVEKEECCRELTLEEVIAKKNQYVKTKQYDKAAEYRDLESKLRRNKEDELVAREAVLRDLLHKQRSEHAKFIADCKTKCDCKEETEKAGLKYWSEMDERHFKEPNYSSITTKHEEGILEFLSMSYENFQKKVDDINNKFSKWKAVNKEEQDRIDAEISAERPSTTGDSNPRKWNRNKTFGT